jgi:hypothetical protein
MATKIRDETVADGNVTETMDDHGKSIIYELPRHDPQRRTDGRGPGGKKHNGGWLCSVIVGGSDSESQYVCQSGRSMERRRHSPGEITVRA